MIKIRQPNIFEVKEQKFDVFIAASGFESRSTSQALELAHLANIKIALGFANEIDDPIRIQNDQTFKNYNFNFYTIDGEVSSNSYLDEIVKTISDMSKDNDLIKVYIDYSCMTKNWYSYLLYCLSSLPFREKITAYFGYSHAKYVPFNGNQTLNRIVKPLFGYCNLSVPSKPTALIIGMGNEPNRIYGLKEYFDAAPYMFYSDSSFNSNYSKEIELINENIINETPQNNIFKFPIRDLIYTHYILENLCLELLKDYRVIIAPCGPKPFALLAMITSLSHNDSLEVWRISPGSNISKIDRTPIGVISVVELNFIN